MIRLVQEWSVNGIRAVYGKFDNYDAVDDIANAYDSITEDLITQQSKLPYTEEEIRRACNTLIYGAGSGKDTYESIMDIPGDLFSRCIQQMNRHIDIDTADKKYNIQDSIYHIRLEDTGEEKDE